MSDIGIHKAMKHLTNAQVELEDDLKRISFLLKDAKLTDNANLYFENLEDEIIEAIRFIKNLRGNVL